ncbi:hypothetical protein B0T26DRAFT_64520 [Lasiosphaeria miniovina]|uniref:Secreted protein n=1 Tax=Lasiosphaeria miniovina TaxID=1954250 RepID=A0AA40BHG7_9PEZI|nr:uncharacterized protein B0T26DRAFT_64520 [Lasiosphaeria miniovina]KAK0734311.1 hypothetical protein B0T26DRAFT_64520 [Lasiosphaeria miniovina]
MIPLSVLVFWGLLMTATEFRGVKHDLALWYCFTVCSLLDKLCIFDCRGKGVEGMWDEMILMIYRGEPVLRVVF